MSHYYPQLLGDKGNQYLDVYASCKKSVLPFSDGSVKIGLVKARFNRLTCETATWWSKSVQAWQRNPRR